MAPTLRSRSQTRRSSSGMTKSTRSASSSPASSAAALNAVLGLSLLNDISMMDIPQNSHVKVKSNDKSKSSTPTPSPNVGRIKISGPKFVTFPCRWKRCEAELHNIAALLRHMLKVHGSLIQDYPIPCLWEDPEAVSPGPDVPEELRSSPRYSPPSCQGLEFSTLKDFQAHFEKAHLTPLAWRMGDGPRESYFDGEVADPLAFLRDASGRLITPSIEGQKIEKGNAYRLNSRRYAAAYETKQRIDRMGKVVKTSKATG